MIIFLFYDKYYILVLLAYRFFGGIIVGMVENIKLKIGEVREHFNKYVNNKYVKNITSSLGLANSVKHDMNIIFINDLIYLDTRGTIEDLYVGIKAVSYFIREVRINVLKNLSSYTGSSFLSSSAQKNFSENDKVLAKMAYKNYPMNIKILADQVYELLTMIIDFDNSEFGNDPAYKHVKGFDEIGKNLMAEES